MSLKEPIRRESGNLNGRHCSFPQQGRIISELGEWRQQSTWNRSAQSIIGETIRKFEDDKYNGSSSVTAGNETRRNNVNGRERKVGEREETRRNNVNGRGRKVGERERESTENAHASNTCQTPSDAGRRVQNHAFRLQQQQNRSTATPTACMDSKEHRGYTLPQRIAE
jgi:hypothetical protein